MSVLPKDNWEVVRYEIEMLNGLYDAACQDSTNNLPQAVRNAITESLCLHTRILVDILISKNHTRSDEITLQKLLPGFTHPSIAKLEAHYATAHEKDRGKPCWVLKKKLAHPTTERGSSWDYTATVNGLRPLIADVVQAIQAERDLRNSQQVLRPLGGVDPRFCAKTSTD